MIIVKIVGGLGNQMFCYAYAKALEQKGNKVKIDISAYDTYKIHGGFQLDNYYINLEESSSLENSKYYKNNFLSKVLRKIGFSNSNIIEENSLLFDDKLLEIKDNNYVSGYFQCEGYFINIREILLEQFSINSNVAQYTKKIKKEILVTNNCCSIHVRRGDFINNLNKNIHGSCTLEYYKKAEEIIKLKDINVKFFIFSDDIQWCKNNFEIDNAIYVKTEEDRLPHEDMYLMSLCKYNIIANSSYSWWAAWLNKNDDKLVIAPKRWFIDDNLERQSKDIVCKEWQKL